MDDMGLILTFTNCCAFNKIVVVRAVCEVTSVPLLLVSARNNNNIPGKAPPLSRVPSSSSAAEICANNERDQAEAFPCVLSPSFIWTQPSFDLI